MLTDAEFRYIQCTLLLCADIPGCPSVPSSKGDAIKIIDPLSTLLRSQIRAVGEIICEVAGEELAVGIDEAERLARARIDELKGTWSKAFGHSELDHLFTSIRSRKFDRQ